MYYIGIDLGGTNIAGGIVNETGKIVHKGSISTFRERPYQEILKDMAFLALRIIKESGIDKEEIKAIGVGSPGTPNSAEGILIYNNNLNFKNVPIRTELQKYINLPVLLDNDANCAALAESVAGAASGVADSVTITLGTGVGAGIVINHKIYSGFNYAASELGHMVIMVDGDQCTCGRKGCWEVYASATGLIRQTKVAAEQVPDSLIHKLVQGDLTKVNAKIPFDAAKANDTTAKQVVSQYIKYVATGLINIINTLQPEVIVIGGGVSKEGDYLLNPLHELINQEAYCHEWIPQTQIKIAQLKNDAGIVGAAMLCR